VDARGVHYSDGLAAVDEARRRLAAMAAEGRVNAEEFDKLEDLLREFEQPFLEAYAVERTAIKAEAYAQAREWAEEKKAVRSGRKRGKRAGRVKSRRMSDGW
jgi:hypothetical protein